MIKLNAAQVGKAKSLLLDLCIRTRLVANTRPEAYCSNRGYKIPFLSSRAADKATACANTIIHTLINRTFNFKEIDSTLETMKSCLFSFGENPGSETPSWTIKNVAGAAKFLAWVCAENKIYWNDVAYTAAERESWKATSTFAYYLFEAECFVSQPSRARRSPRAVVGTSSASTAASGAPKSGYKSAGPQSAFVAGLVGEPGKKVEIAESILYCIAGDKMGTIVPKAFIHPVENPAIGERAKVNAAGLPVIKFGAGNGYTDLTIFSTTASVMEDILAKMDPALTSKYSGVSVSRTRNDSSGYFKVNTEFGEVLVKPTKLNEKLFTEVFSAMVAKDEEPINEAITIQDVNQFVRDSKMYD